MLFLIVITDGDVVVLEFLLFLCQPDGKLGDVLIWVLGTPLVLLQFFDHLSAKRAPIVFKVLNVVMWMYALVGIQGLLDLCVVTFWEGQFDILAASSAEAGHFTKLRLS